MNSCLMVSGGKKLSVFWVPISMVFAFGVRSDTSSTDVLLTSMKLFQCLQLSQ